MPFKNPEKRKQYAREHQQRWNESNREKRRGYSARWRTANKSKIRAKAQRVSRERKAFLDWLQDRPCADCGCAFPPPCMDFDHVRGEKVFDVSQMLLWSWARIAEEVQKCEVVCANCHRLRTWRRKNENLNG